MVVNLIGICLAEKGTFFIWPVSVLPLNSMVKRYGAARQLSNFAWYAAVCSDKKKVPMLYGSYTSNCIVDTLVALAFAKPIMDSNVN